MKVTKNLSSLHFKPLLDAISTHGIQDCVVQNDFQHTYWIPAKNNERGLLDKEFKNAHDIALLGLVNELKTRYQYAIKTDPNFIRQLTDMIVRLGGDGCYVSLWGIFSPLCSRPSDVEIWGCSLCSDDFRVIGTLTLKAHSLKATHAREFAMKWMADYLTNHLSSDYGELEVESILSAEQQLSSLGISVKSFRLLARQQVKDPIPAQLLFDENFTSSEEVMVSIMKYRTKKPSLRMKIVPAIFVSSEGLERLRTEKISFQFVEIHS